MRIDRGVQLVARANPRAFASKPLARRNVGERHAHRSARKHARQVAQDRPANREVDARTMSRSRASGKCWRPSSGMTTSVTAPPSSRSSTPRRSAPTTTADARRLLQHDDRLVRKPQRLAAVSASWATLYAAATPNAIRSRGSRPPPACRARRSRAAATAAATSVLPTPPATILPTEITGHGSRCARDERTARANAFVTAQNGLSADANGEKKQSSGPRSSPGLPGFFSSSGATMAHRRRPRSASRRFRAGGASSNVRTRASSFESWHRQTGETVEPRPLELLAAIVSGVQRSRMSSSTTGIAFCPHPSASSALSAREKVHEADEAAVAHDVLVDPFGRARRVVRQHHRRAEQRGLERRRPGLDESGASRPEAASWLAAFECVAPRLP